LLLVVSSTENENEIVDMPGVVYSRKGLENTGQEKGSPYINPRTESWGSISGMIVRWVSVRG